VSKERYYLVFEFRINDHRKMEEIAEILDLLEEIATEGREGVEG